MTIARVADLVLAEGEAEAHLAFAAWGAGAPVIRLDVSDWAPRIRMSLAPNDVALVTDGLTRSGTVVAALRQLVGVTSLTWYLLPRIVDGANLTKIEEALSRVQLFHVDVDEVQLAGTPCVALRFELGSSSPVARAAALTAAARLGGIALPPTGRGCIVAAIGAEARSWFADWARVEEVDPSTTSRVADIAHGAVDLLFLSDDSGHSDDQLAHLIAEARNDGMPVVGLLTGVLPPPWQDDLDLALTRSIEPGEGSMLAVPPLDLRVAHRVEAITMSGRWLAIPSVLPGQAGWDAAMRTLAAVGRQIPVDLALPPGAAAGRLPAGTRVVARSVGAGSSALDLAAQHEGIIEDPSFHPSVAAWARSVVDFGGRGLPVVTQVGSTESTRILGERVSSTLATADLAELRDSARRDLFAIRLRRAILMEHSHEARWRTIASRLAIPVRRPLTVSIIVATNRPEYLSHLAEQVSCQTYPELEVVLALHGDVFDRSAVERFRARVETPVTIVRIPEDHRLGDALNAATDAASGQTITKFDDDDWYGAEHVVDLYLAAQESGAHLVGKAAEFIYLRDLDVTVRRFQHGRGRPSRVLSGACLFIAKTDLQSVGGWRRTRRAVDQRLIDDVLSGGGRTHRTHGYGFVVNRHGEGHTWDPGIDYFLRQSDQQYRGLRLDLADVESSPLRPRPVEAVHSGAVGT